MENEVWKDVLGYEGLYQVSNLGRVKRLPYKLVGRTIGKKKEYIRNFPEKIMIGSICENGYIRVTLSKDGKSCYKNIHKLVADAFIPNPNNYPCINHKDETRTNNNINNLEWCSYSYNNTYGNAKKKFAESYSKNHSTPVAMFSLCGEKINEFPSIKSAAKFVGGNECNIYRAAKKIRKTAYGYIWRTI